MRTGLRSLAALAVLVGSAAPVVAGQFVVELPAPLDADLTAHETVQLDESLSAGADSYAVFSAPDRAALDAYLEAADIAPEKILPVDFVNSPTVGGGTPAADTVRHGHHVYVVERSVPGVGSFPIERKQKIAMASVAAVEKLGDVIEWDHSYLTSEGTYCVYRADSEDTIREHATLAGAVVSKIIPVAQVVHRTD